MKNYIETRVLDEANYIIQTGCTVRSAAKVFGVSKSTIHMDMTERLLEVNRDIAKEVRRVLDSNLEVRHIRGGE